MEESVDVTCARCDTGLVVMSRIAYLAITDTDLDFTLHKASDALIAIADEDGTYRCPVCGRRGRPPASAERPV